MVQFPCQIVVVSEFWDAFFHRVHGMSYFRLLRAVLERPLLEIGRKRLRVGAPIRRVLSTATGMQRQCVNICIDIEMCYDRSAAGAADAGQVFIM